MCFGMQICSVIGWLEPLFFRLYLGGTLRFHILRIGPWWAQCVLLFYCPRVGYHFGGNLLYLQAHGLVAVFAVSTLLSGAAFALRRCFICISRLFIRFYGSLVILPAAGMSAVDMSVIVSGPRRRCVPGGYFVYITVGWEGRSMHRWIFHSVFAIGRVSYIRIYLCYFCLVKDCKLSTGVNATFNALCYG